MITTNNKISYFGFYSIGNSPIISFFQKEETDCNNFDLFVSDEESMIDTSNTPKIDNSTSKVDKSKELLENLVIESKHLMGQDRSLIHDAESNYHKYLAKKRKVCCV